MKNQNKQIKFRIPKFVYELMQEDLRKPHPFAYERVGFLFTKTILLFDTSYLIVATDYLPIADEDYIEDMNVGAKINSNSIRTAMQGIVDRNGGCFHVHLHNHSGKPYPSFTDQESLPGIVNSFSNIASKQANGILILSRDGFYTDIKYGNETQTYKANTISVVGYPFLFQYSGIKINKNTIYDRQSFLGTTSQFLFENIRVGIIGYGGGGSHIGQQLAHIGVKNIIVFDDDKVEATNLNRLIGSVFLDIKNAVLKTTIASRIIKKILPSAKVITVNKKWQQAPSLLQSCDVVFGCVDSYTERQQLEAECRRFLIPLIDIGMDVHQFEGGYSMSGQILLSMPGSACQSCYGYLTEKKLAKEAEKYGKVGSRPQVVWPNGVLASTAVGILVDLITGWTKETNREVYLSYDGNSGKIEEHVRLRFSPKYCEHYPLNEVGPIKYRRI